MTKMYDPSDLASHGPQITARPGTKRHIRQLIARKVFLTIIHANAKANLRRAIEREQAAYAHLLNDFPVRGNG